MGTGFPKRSCSNKKIERDDDSKKSHPALGFLTTAPKAVVEPIHPKAVAVILTTPTRLPQTRERELTGNKGTCLLAT